MTGAAEGETSMAGSGTCVFAARRHPRGRRAAAAAIGAVALALTVPMAATAASAAPGALTVTATITVGNAPWGVAVNPLTGAVYVANSLSNTVSVISG